MTTVIWKAELLDEDGVVVLDDRGHPGYESSGGRVRYTHASREMVEHWIMHESMHSSPRDKRTWRLVKVEESVEVYVYEGGKETVDSEGVDS